SRQADHRPALASAGLIIQANLDSVRRPQLATRPSCGPLPDHALAQEIDPAAVDLQRYGGNAALVTAEGLAALQRDTPVVQRAGDAVAMNDALAERALPVR